MPRSFPVFFIATALALGAAGARAQTEAAPEEPDPNYTNLDDALAADAVKKLFTGNSEDAIAMKRGVPVGRTYQAYYKADGTFSIRETSGAVWGGQWFVDPAGRICFRPKGKDKTKCDHVVPEGEFYIRVRDGDRRGKVKIRNGNAYGL